MAFEVGQFLQRVDIVKRALIRKGDFNRLVARVPRADLTFTRLQKGAEVVGQTRAQQREDGVNRRLAACVDGGDGGDIGLMRVEGVRESRGKIGWATRVNRTAR